ncbi:hypothetical protein GCM10009000_124700 [Halobacterium noricense]
MKPVNGAYSAATIGSLVIFGVLQSVFGGFFQRNLLFVGLVGAVWVSFILIFVALFKLPLIGKEGATR